MINQNYTRSVFALLCLSVLLSIPVSHSALAQVKKMSVPASSSQAPSQQQGVLEFQVSVRDAGFMGWTASGTVAGMMDRGFSLDGFQARIVGTSESGVWYSVCTDDGVWQPWVTGGETAGAVNQRNIHAIALHLYGLPRTNIVYRVHLTGGEWLEWVKNGAAAGAKGRTIDAIEIRLEPGNSSVSSFSATEPPPPLTAETVTQNAPANVLSGATTQSSSGSPTMSKTATSSSAQQVIESFTVQDTPAPTVTKSSALKKTSSASNQVQNAQSAANNNQSPNTQQQSNNQSNNNGLQQLGQGIGQGLGQGVGNQGNNQGNTVGNNIPNNQQWNNSQPNNQQWNNSQPNNQQWNNPPNNTGAQWNNGNNQFSGQNWSQWTNQPMQRAQGFGTAAQPVFVPISSRKIALIANNGRFVSAGNDPRAGAVFTATSSGVRETEIFDLAFVGEHRVALRTVNGRYLGLQPVAGGSARLVPQSDVIGQNEVFEMLSAGQDRVAFRAASGHFLSVEEFGAFRLFAKEGFIGQWEYFGIATSDGRPLLSEAQNTMGWQTRQEGNRVIVVDQQGRIVESADRILVLMGNTPQSPTSNTAVSSSSSSPATNTTTVGANATGANTTSAAATGTAATATTKPAVEPSTYLTPIELSIVQELNFVRTKPGEYATMLEGYRRFYKGKTFTAPGHKALTTKEGVKALDEAVLTLKMTRPLEALTASQALSKAARDHVDNTGPRGIIGHVGSDKSNPNDRAARYGKGVVNENCCYNRSTAREIVVRLLIDDGTADRGYRKNILNPAFKLIGTAFGLHKTQQTVCSQVFAAEFTEK